MSSVVRDVAPTAVSKFEVGDLVAWFRKSDDTMDHHFYVVIKVDDSEFSGLILYNIQCGEQLSCRILQQYWYLSKLS